MSELYRSKLPCPYSECGSSDAVTIYQKENESLDGFCFSCQQYIPPKLIRDFYKEDFEEVEAIVEAEYDFSNILTLECRGWRERRIGKEASEFYGIRTKFDDDGKVIARYYPITKNGELVGYKKRDAKKDFPVMGKNSAKCEFFGQSLFPAGGKFLVICGGEEDAASLWQALKQSNPNYNTPVVSPSVGEGGTASQIKANFEWVSSFEKVIFMLDNDNAGKEATEKAVKLLKPGQGYIAQMRLKDPNEYVKARQEKELVNAFWRADRYSPAGIVGSSQTWDALIARAKWEKLPLPQFAGELGAMLNGGPALGEITSIFAASSVGKTHITNEFVYHWIFEAPYKVGIVSLESELGELTENLLSIHLSKKLANIPDDERISYYETEEAKQKHRELTTAEDGTDRFIVLDHQGDTVGDELKNKIEYMVKVCGCRIIILDPLTLALSGKSNEGMDEFMAWLLRFVKRELISHINICHVRKSASGSKANSRGADIHEEDGKGSGSIYQVSMNNILLMRDKENSDPIIRNTTKVVVSKARRTGHTGLAGYWFYDHNTARLAVGEDPEEADFSEDEDVFDNTDVDNHINPDELEV